MKTNILGILMLISAAVSAQSSVHVNSSSTAAVDSKKGQTALTVKSKSSQQTTVKSNKISGETSLQGGAAVNRQAVENPDNKAQPQPAQQMKTKTEGTVSATKKEGAVLTSSGSTAISDKETQSAGIEKNGVKSGEALSASADGKAKAGVRTGEAANTSVQKTAKTVAASGDGTIASAGSNMKSTQSAKLKNANNVKVAAKPQPVKINTQIKTVTAVKIK